MLSRCFSATDVRLAQEPKVEKSFSSEIGPGNFLEVTKLLPLLSGSTDGPVFHIVAPSLPNFGFSSGTNKKGFTLTKYAETLHKLMLKLGYNEYGK